MQTVQKWERCLAHVSEVIDEWLATQKKWLYLEGIFIGGDIRSQLPEEAQKFDDIDKAYRRVFHCLLDNFRTLHLLTKIFFVFIDNE